jgi:hypothetical protein
MLIKFLNKKISWVKFIIVSLVTVIISGIFIYNIDDDSFTNFYNSIFTTIYCDAAGIDYTYVSNTVYVDQVVKFRDDLICIHSFQHLLNNPVEAYEITDFTLYRDMLFKGDGKLCIFTPDQIIIVNGLIVNNTDLYTVHPDLVFKLFDLFGIDY